MTLRPALPSDASSIAALSVEVWLGTYLKQGINRLFADYALSEFTPAKIAALIVNPNEYIVVSDNVQGIDGFIQVSPGRIAPVVGCSDIEISTFYVQPLHHGKGIGKALLAAALDHARALGAPSVWLTTNAENMPAIGFYLAQGFAQVGHTHFRLRDQVYLNTVYRYDLI